MRIQVSVGEAVDEDVGSVVAIDYETLRDPETDLISEIEKAYGPKGLGILCVVNVPGSSTPEWGAWLCALEENIRL